MKTLSYENLLNLILKNKVTKINICGSPASGKSTLAERLSEDTGFQIIDLDDYLYSSGCKRKIHQEDITIIGELLNIDNMIIDGTYTSSLKQRVKDVDLFILTNSNNVKCLIRFCKRLLIKRNLKCGEKITAKTLRLIWTYKQVEVKKIISVIPKTKLIRFSGYE